MILQEERPDQAFPEIIVPGIQYITMKHIVRFLYTDSIDFVNLLSFPSLVNLLKSAKILQLESLASTCEQVLSMYTHTYTHIYTQLSMYVYSYTYTYTYYVYTHTCM